MDERIFKTRTNLLKYGTKQYQLAKHLGIQDYLLCRMLNGHVELPDALYRKIEKYFEQLQAKAS